MMSWGGWWRGGWEWQRDGVRGVVDQAHGTSLATSAARKTIGPTGGAGRKLEFERKANGVFNLGHGVAGKLS
jgi:hypothetical protein